MTLLKIWKYGCYKHLRKLILHTNFEQSIYSGNKYKFSPKTDWVLKLVTPIQYILQYSLNHRNHGKHVSQQGKEKNYIMVKGLDCRCRLSGFDSLSSTLTSGVMLANVVYHAVPQGQQL